MKRVFKYRFSRRTLYLSAFYILVLALIGLGLHSLYIGGYLSAWFVSLVVALFALMSLSIPRKMVVKKATVEILCLLDMTEIPRMEIASVQRVDPRQMRWVDSSVRRIRILRLLRLLFRPENVRESGRLRFGVEESGGDRRHLRTTLLRFVHPGRRTRRPAAIRMKKSARRRALSSIPVSSHLFPFEYLHQPVRQIGVLHHAVDALGARTVKIRREP